MGIFKNNIFDSKNAITVIDTYRILLEQFKNDRNDKESVSNFIYTDRKGFLKAKPIQELLDMIPTNFKLNTLTMDEQFLVTGLAGTDFHIVSTGNTHTFNIPSASSTTRGLLTAFDWSMFNAKQDAITPGDLTSNSNAINVVGGTGAVLSNILLDINGANSADDGILLATDWNIFNNKIGSATNGLTLTGTTVELGGNLTKNTTIGAGSFSISFNNTQYNFDSALAKPMRFNGTGTTSIWHGLNSGGYDSQRFNIQNTTGVNFTNTFGITSLFVDNSNSRIGIRTVSPASALSNVSSLTGHIDGLYSVNTNGISYEINGSGYIASFVQKTAGSQGILIKNVFSNSSDANILRLMNGDVWGDNNVLTAKADGVVHIGKYNANYGSTWNLTTVGSALFVSPYYSGAGISISGSGSDYMYLGYNVRPTSTSGSYLYDRAERASQIFFGGTNSSYPFSIRLANSGAAGGAITFVNVMDSYLTGSTITTALKGNIGINTNTPNSSAVLDVVSTTKGFLPPRMTTTQKNAISSPALGLVVYDVTTNKLCVYNGAWVDLH